MLVEQYLVAVVSLPAGVFNPYSGVKTSILILDKSLAKQSDTVGFFKVENDGFNLGAQRRPIDKNDLPQVLADVNEYLRRLRAKESVAAEDFTPTRGLIVAKEKIAANGDYNCSAERYREGAAQSTTFPWVKIGDVVEAITPPTKIQKTEFADSGKFPIIDQSQDAIAGWTDDESALVRPSKPLVIFGDHTCAIKLADRPFAQGADGIKILQTTEALDPSYLYYVLRIKPLESDGYQRHFSKLKEHEIPLPPLDVQKEIVAEIEAYQRVSDGARAVLDHYRPHIPIQPDWPMVELGEVCEMGGEITTDIDGSLPSFGADSIESNTGKLLKTETAAAQGVRGPVYVFNGERLLYSKIRPYLNKLTVVDLHGYCSSDMYPLAIKPENVEMRYLATYMLSDAFIESIRGHYERASIPKINQSQLFGTAIPLPPLEAQRSIVSEIEAERRLVEANRELIARMQAKVAATLARIWGDAETPAAGRYRFMTPLSASSASPW